MKKFETPEIEIVSFRVEDVISTSGIEGYSFFRSDETRNIG